MRLNQVTVPARDIARSIAFYQTLGFRLIVKDAHYARFELPDGEATFSLHLAADTEGAANGASIYFECDDLDERVAELKKKKSFSTPIPSTRVGCGVKRGSAIRPASDFACSRPARPGAIRRGA